MATYDILEAGFSSLDETINFGSRAVGLNTSLYEIVTVAVIRSSETNKTSDPVKIISEYQHEKIFFSTDKTLRILKDKNITDEIGSFEFDNIIDTFCISSCGNYILICTQGGKLTIRTLFSSLTNGNDNDEAYNYKFPVIFEEELAECTLIKRYFIGSFFNDSSFYIVTFDGLVKKIVIDTEKGNSIQFKSEIIFNLKTIINICAFGYPYLCLEGSQLCIFNLNNGSCQTDEAIGFKSLQASRSYFFASDNMGNIYRIYPNELVIFCLNGTFPDLVDNFDDLLFIDDGEKKSKVHLLGITKNLPSKNKKEIQLKTYPGAEIVYSIPLEGPVHLMNIKDPTEDVFCFTEIRKNDVLLEIRLQVIVKADPEFRLKKLIQKQLFDDAELFAKTFNISSEIIAQAKALNIVNKMLCTTKEIDQLLEILDTIDDMLFKLNCCDTVDCAFGTDTRRVLCYGAFMNVPVKDCGKNNDNILLIKKMEFNCKVHRFDTFMQIYEKYDPGKWKYFAECELINEMKILLQKGKIEEASVVFSRLDRNTVYELTPLKIEEITLILNKDLLSNTLFLSTFIPISLKYVPDSFVIFIRWLYDRVLQLEKQSSDFPECAIRFVREITKLMDFNTPVKKHLHHNEDLQNLTCLLNALEDLKILLNKYGVRFPLSEYLNNPFTVIRTLLNANNDATNFEVLMKDFVCPFIFKNNLNMDLLLIDEIENLLVYEEAYWISMVPILLKFITCVDKKLELTYKMLEMSDIPWSDNVKNIAQLTCQLAPSNPVAERITEHLNNEQILIIMRKYNINKAQFESFEDKIFYFNRIIYLNRTSVFEDIHQLCMDDEVRQEADLLLINNLILKQDYDKAMNVMDQNSPERIVALGKHILGRCFRFASSYDLPKKYRDPYFIILKLIWNRLEKHVKSVFDKRRLEFDYKIAYATYGLSECFNMQINSTDLIRNRNNLLNTLVQQSTDLYLNDDAFNCATFMRKCEKLAHFFDIDLDTVFMKCLVNGKNFNPFIKLGQYLLESSKCSKLLACWALYLVKYLKNSVNDDFDESLSDVFSNVSKNQENYLVGIQLAKKLSIKAMMNATSEENVPIMEVNRWVDSFFYFTNFSKLLNMDTLQIYHFNNALSHGMQSVEAIKIVFNIYCATFGSFLNPNMKFLNYFTSNLAFDEAQFYKEMDQLTWNINTLLKEGQHLTCFIVIKTIQEGFLCNSNMSQDMLMNLQSLIKTNWLPKTLEAIMSYKYIDKTLLLNLMLLCDTNKRQLLNYLKVYKRQPNKLIVITQVGLELCKYHNNPQGKLDLINNLNLCKWWNRITDKNINYEFFFSAKCEDRLEALILAKQVDLDNLPEYCSDFVLDSQKTYLKYLEMTLKNWEPQYKKIVDIHGKTTINMQSFESDLGKECQNILKCITNTDDVLLLVDQLWPVINYYYYEVFMVLLLIHNKLSVTKNSMFEAYQTLLLFLKNYQRVSNPSRSEIEKWFGTFPLKAFIDPLSEFRLPLTSTFFSSDIWTIIKPEVNLETYKEWFEVVPILKQFLNENDICTYAINSALPIGLSGGTCETWELLPKYDHVIAKVEECAKHITDLERATAAVYTLMCNMNPGADKVKMAELSYKYAQVYRESASSDDVEKVYLKVKQRYFNYSTIYILHKYKLTESEYLKLVAQPLDLVSKLYLDPRIPKKICSIHFDCPDINSAVDDICFLFDLISKKIKFSVLLEFLKSDSTLDLDKDAESDCLLRAYYICEGTDFHKLLLKIGMNENDVESSISVRANALKCFYYASDVDSLEIMSGMDRDQFLIYMNKVSVMAKLEDLGLKLTVDELDQLNKKKLLKKLAEIDKSLAIRCISTICKIYELDNLTYWKYIVNSAIRFNMITDLRDYVEYLKFRCVEDFIKNAWNTIMADAFKKEPNYIAALRLLQTCPVIYALNFEDYIEKCLTNKRPEIAAALLQYVSIEKHEAYLKEILLRKGIFEDVGKLKNEGIFGIDKVIKVLDSYCHKQKLG